MSKIVKIYATDEAGVDQINKPKVDFLINDAIENLISQGVFQTDDEGIFFQRQLEYIQAESYDALYPDLMGREIFDLNTEGGEGINVITYRSYDKRGETAIISGKATDLPRGDISGEEYSIYVKTLGNAFGFSRQELAASKVTGMPLEVRKAEATRRSYEEKVNQIIFFGSPENKLHGLYGGPAEAPWSTVTIQAVEEGAAGKDTTWGGIHKTGDEVIRDLVQALSAMYTDTKKMFSPDKILISVQKKMYLENTPRNNLSDMSLMTWFLANNRFIKSASQFVDINELDGIFPDIKKGDTISDFDEDGKGVQGFTVMVSGSSNSRVREPFPYMHLPVQYRGLEFEINCYGRFAGLEMIRPAAFQHFTGI